MSDAQRGPSQIGDTLRRQRNASTPDIGHLSDDEEGDHDEEAEVHTMVRMLEDSQGRLQYIGDSANLSFLQLLRMIVETVTGPSQFSLDLGRHQITERKFTASPDVDLRHLLPSQETALLLSEAFFTNTHGMLEVFIEKHFLKRLDRSYNDVSGLDNVWLCHLYLVLALGFAFATPETGTREYEIIHRLRTAHPYRGEEYYFAAKKLADPFTGFEDAGLWSIQALTLMSLYMLAQSRRNAAYVYTGMAIRSAHALGVHREEVLIVFSEEEQEERRKLWRSLYVLDLFLSVSLGRPLAISGDDNSSDVLSTEKVPEQILGKPETRHVCAAALEATLRSSHVMTQILRKVYLPRKISIKEAQYLARECRSWPKKLAPFLSWRRASTDDVRQSIAILHCNLYYCHSVILLSRPFFLHLLSNEIQRERLKLNIAKPRQHKEMNKFSAACMDACTHTIAITFTAFKAGYLARLDPFPAYFVFAAALVIFVNELARPGVNILAAESMANSIAILDYCGKSDPQASCTVAILRSFHDVIQKQRDPLGTTTNFPPQLQNASLPNRAHFGAQQPQQLHNTTIAPDPYSFPGDFLQSSGNSPAFQTLRPAPLNTSMEEENWPMYASPDRREFGNQQVYPTGILQFDNILPSSIDPISSATSGTADDDFNLDTLWDWPAGDPLPTADSPSAGNLPPHSGPYGPY